MKTYTIVDSCGIVIDVAYTAEEAAIKQQQYAEEQNG